eukprot:TRINITY_DN5283_c0_g1_i7.p1 TRINITY_DN5283_c0_g1~~TRINITY_DN5283_c0_g1_i7.p1  ORF type:complete len:329 (-),score=65.15 TRINITY_DN5283_c0_g1_i7:625-1611(-)
MDVERMDSDKLSSERDVRRRSDRKNRDTFRQLMRDYKDTGTINAKMRWREVLDILKADENANYILLAVEKNSGGSRPKEIFEDVLEEMEEIYERDRSFLKQLDLDSRIKPETAFEEFRPIVSEVLIQTEKQQLGNEDSPNKKSDFQLKVEAISDLNLKLYFDEIMGKLMEKVAKENRRKRRAREDLMNLFKRWYKEGLIYERTTFQQVLDLNVGREKEFENVPKDEQPQVYDEFVAKVKAKRQRREEKKQQSKVEEKDVGTPVKQSEQQSQSKQSSQQHQQSDVKSLGQKIEDIKMEEGKKATQQVEKDRDQELEGGDEEGGKKTQKD